MIHECFWTFKLQIVHLIANLQVKVSKTLKINKTVDLNNILLTSEKDMTRRLRHLQSKNYQMLRSKILQSAHIC